MPLRSKPYARRWFRDQATHDFWWGSISPAMMDFAELVKHKRREDFRFGIRRWHDQRVQRYIMAYLDLDFSEAYFAACQKILALQRALLNADELSWPLLGKQARTLESAQTCAHKRT